MQVWTAFSAPYVRVQLVASVAQVLRTLHSTTHTAPCRALFDFFFPRIMQQLEAGFDPSPPACPLLSWQLYTEMLDAFFVGVAGKSNLSAVFDNVALRRGLLRYIEASPSIPSWSAQFHALLTAARILRYARKVHPECLSELSSLKTVS